MNEKFYQGYELAKNSLLYKTLGSSELYRLAGQYLSDYQKDKDTYAFGKSKAIIEILSERVSIASKVRLRGAG